ncbi:MAG: SDR family NAD(P)-dependent oxidoreductase [Polyangiales bacterium]
MTEQESGNEDATRQQGTDIAIIGMAARLPGARTVAEFWANVRDGVESIRTLGDEELLAAGVSRSELDDPSYVKVCPTVADIDKFDARFFGFSPRDASVMDPAHRMFLELAWEAFEKAGYTALPDEGVVGVFASAGAPLYMQENVRTNPDLMRSMGEFLVRHTGNDMNFLATRVSYEMDLRGPSMNVQTACSSALVSLHMACQSLERGECTLALAGGATILIPHGRGYHYKDGEIMSPDGHCRPFDAKSAGTVFGSGAGCVVLKRLSDALDDGDTIHAVIKGSAINNDGSVKVGYLAPGVDGQAAVIDAALKRAGLTPEDISYIETHGTGTLVGDPIEVEALNQAFGRHTQKRGFCAIGSVKSNVGHLGEAAGIASLIKAVMALKHRKLPPSLGYETPNPQIDFENSPFFVNATLRDWKPEGDRPLRCGVTALGAGGTNCHVILEEPPEPLEGEGARAKQLLVLSAKTRTALDQASENLAAAIEAQPVLDLADAAYTLALGRRGLPHRRALAAGTREEAIQLLRTREPKQVPTGHLEGATPALVFMFPGGGAQYARMGAELYEKEDVYRDAVDACLEIVTPVVGRDLRELMFCAPEEAQVATRTLERPSLTLPSLFATSYALAKLFESWGVTPSALVGHSMGEYVAATLAGVFTLEDALRLVMLRGRLFEKVEAGGMLSVSMPEAEVKKLMPEGLDIAAVNAPELCVASGPVAKIEALEKLLTEREIDNTRIRIDVAAHSAMLEPILAEFRALCRTIPFKAPEIPIVSNLTGKWLSPADATDPEYWVKHLRSTVRFADCIETVLAQGDRALLEVGPGRTLSSLSRAQRTPVKAAFNSMRHPQEEASDLGYALTTLGRLWVAGVDVDWTALYAGQLRNRIELPSYPFESQSFWIEPGQLLAHAGQRALTKRADVGDWFYGLAFMQRPLLTTGEPAARFLVFADGTSLSEKVLEALAGRDVVVVTPGSAVAQVEPKHWEVAPESSNQFVDLMQALTEQGQLPQHVVYLWSAARPLTGLSSRRGLTHLDKGLAESFFAPVYLARALGGLAEPVRLTYVTAGLAQTGDDPILPHRATILGPVHVSPREFAQVRTRCIDVPSQLGARGRKLAAQLVEELLSDHDDRVVALRAGGERWVQTIAPLRLPSAPEQEPWLRDGGVYLITGGLGGIGLEVATYMARKKRVKLALLARAGLPPESEWDAILARPDARGRGASRIRKVRELRALGAEVTVLSGDVVDEGSMKRVIAEVHAQLGPIRGVVHGAGVLDDEPMLTKTQPGMRRVLAPKVHGTLILDQLVTEPLDFFLVFSSVASFLGLPGQVDYTAANAFLDAFAHERSRRAPGRTLVINWNAWRDVGMAATSYSQMPSPSSSCAHPALDGYSEESGAGRVFSTDFSIDRHWMLSEHRIKGSYALLPGTAYVELARAAFSVGRGEGPVEITDLSFATPFQVSPGEVRRLNIHLTPAGDAYEVAMRSGADPRSAPHVVGDVRAYTGPAAKRIDLAAISARCTVREEQPKDRFLDQDFVSFGPRWANIDRVRYGRGEALMELSIDPRFRDDLAHYKLHPAVMDMATGGAQPLIPNVDLKNDFYVPIGYARVRFLAPMPDKVFSHVRCLDDTGGGFAYFDVTLAGEDGVPFAEISRFTMKQLGARSGMTSAPVTRGAEPARNEVMEALLREAIAPVEGIEAFARIMAQSHVVQAVASSVDVQLWEAQLAAQSHVNPAEAGGAPSGFSRPTLASDYEAPKTKTETVLAEIWAELVGIRQVGVKDDFFELGGNSLVAVRLFAAIKKKFKVSLPLSTLFEAPTIQALAGLLDARLAPQPETPREGGLAAVPADARGYSSLVAMQPSGTRPPFFCAAGMGGNPLNLAALALLVGLDQPFYGLQPQGLDGQSTPHSSVPEMAAYYVDLVRQKQPRGPYYLGGYSGGGITAFEMARQLEAAGEEVGALVFLDSFAPIMPARSKTDRARVHLERLREQGPSYVTRTLGKRVQSEIANVERMVRRPLSKLFPYRFRLETVADMWLESAAAYQPGVYNGHAMLFRAAVASDLTSGTAKVIDAQHGWAPFVLGGVEVSVCPGDHNTMCEQPNVRVLARRLRAYLDRRIVHKTQPLAAE